jgi:hypothetical protein
MLFTSSAGKTKVGVECSGNSLFTNEKGGMPLFICAMAGKENRSVAVMHTKE